MHELSLAESAMELIEAAAQREGFVRVRVVRMEIGALSCVEPEALRLAFAAASTGTCADAAMLEILSVSGEGECMDCRHRAMLESSYDLCPGCGSPKLKVLRGREMRVIDLEVE